MKTRDLPEGDAHQLSARIQISVCDIVVALKTNVIKVDAKYFKKHNCLHGSSLNSYSCHRLDVTLRFMRAGESGRFKLS